MTLPAFAEVSDLAARIPDGIPAGDQPRAAAVLYDASTLIRAEAGGETWTEEDSGGGDVVVDDLPEIVFVVTLALARRAFVNPDGVRQEGIDTYQVSWGPDDADWREEIRRAAGRTSVWALDTTRSIDDIPDTPAVVEATDDATIADFFP